MNKKLVMLTLALVFSVAGLVIAQEAATQATDNAGETVTNTEVTNNEEMMNEEYDAQEAAPEAPAQAK